MATNVSTIKSIGDSIAERAEMFLELTIRAEGPEEKSCKCYQSVYHHHRVKAIILISQTWPACATLAIAIIV